MAAGTIPSQNCLLVADTQYPDRSASTISPNEQLTAWLVPIPTGKTAAQAATAFVNGLNLPVGTIAVLIDLSVSPPSFSSYQESATWTAD